MAKKIIIVGGVSECTDRQSAMTVQESTLKTLKDSGPSDHEWQWFVTWLPNWDLERKMCHQLRQQLNSPNATVVKLFNLNGRHVQMLPQERLQPPRDITADELPVWICNALVPTKWTGNIVELAICAILCKLVGKKKWIKDTQGHGGTKEADLLSQLPVNPKPPNLESIAKDLLGDLENCHLLILKDGHKERKWSIRLQYVPNVKRSLLAGCFDPLVEAIPQIDDLINNGGNDTFLIEVPPRVRSICQEVTR